nr:metal/formaldehyde-sensitive transcriptional repressor [Variovorax sp. HW608]
MPAQFPSRSPRVKKSLLTRIRRIKGQTEALERKVEAGEDSDRVAVLHQIAAIRGAVNGLMADVLEGQLREHVGAPDITDEQRHEQIEEVVAIVRSYLK